MRVPHALARQLWQDIPRRQNDHDIAIPETFTDDNPWFIAAFNSHKATWIHHSEILDLFEEHHLPYPDEVVPYRPFSNNLDLGASNGYY